MTAPENVPATITIPLDGLEETIAREVGEHHYVSLRNTGGVGWWWGCACGEFIKSPGPNEGWLNANAPGEEIVALHAAHVARHIARALAGDGAR